MYWMKSCMDVLVSSLAALKRTDSEMNDHASGVELRQR